MPTSPLGLHYFLAPRKRSAVQRTAVSGQLSAVRPGTGFGEAYAPPYQGPLPYPVQPAPPPDAVVETVTGYTPPITTFEKMRQMHAASAVPFERDVKSVADPTYREGWDAWFHHAWLPFYQRYAGPDAGVITKWKSNFYSDEIASRAEAFRQQLQSFYDTYPRQKQQSGQPVPPLTGAPPVLGGLPARPSLASRLPWWVWLIGAGVVGGIGYGVYLKRKELIAKRTALETKVLPKLIGKDLAEAAAARDSGSARRRGRTRRSRS